MFRSLLVKLLTTVAVLLASLGLTTVTASPAAAATATTFCFKWASGVPYNTQPVFLYQANGTLVKQGKTNASGCGTFTGLSSTRNYYVHAYVTFRIPNRGIEVHSGNTPYLTGTGTGHVGIGTGVVYFRGYI